VTTEPQLAATLLQTAGGSAALEPDGLPRLVVVDGAAPHEAADLVRVSIIGSGGMGVVELAYQRALRRLVALKRLREREDAPPPAVHVRALLREAAITGELEHPNIVPVHLLGQDAEGSPFFVMKRVEGESWGRLLEQPDHAAWEAAGDDRLGWNLGVLAQLCNAVSFAHSRGVVHRDIKPDNVMIGAYGEVYLLDWGVARRRDDADDAHEAAAIVGTPAYLPPELARPDRGPADERTDVYLLGACLFHVLAGVAPHPGESVTELLRAAEEGALLPLPEAAPAELARICLRALRPAREERFASARELRTALEGFGRHRASLRLTDRAEQRLAALRGLVEGGPGADPIATSRTLYECLFAFEQAAGEWRTTRACALASARRCCSAASRSYATAIRPPCAPCSRASTSHPRRSSRRWRPSSRASRRSAPRSSASPRSRRTSIRPSGACRAAASSAACSRPSGCSGCW
jgi:serine/threonine-protein kinase